MKTKTIVALLGGLVLIGIIGFGVIHESKCIKQSKVIIAERDYLWSMGEFSKGSEEQRIKKERENSILESMRF